MCVFFFKQKTAYEMLISDWSSDVCSSDLSCDRPSCQSPFPLPVARGGNNRGSTNPKIEGKPFLVKTIHRALNAINFQIQRISRKYQIEKLRITDRKSVE